MVVTKAIALRHLPSIPPSYEIEFFSVGEFNKHICYIPLDMLMALSNHL
jgi:hypothetical protein